MLYCSGIFAVGLLVQGHAAAGVDTTAESWAVAADVDPAKKPASGRVDQYGDPLPPRALLRLGTTRFQHQDWLKAAVFSPDGKILAAASVGENFVVLWETPSGRLVKKLPVEGRFAGRLLFSPDGRWLASMGGDFYKHPYLRVWEVASGKIVADSSRPTLTCAFAPDSKMMAAVDEKEIRLWDVPAWKPRPSLPTPARKTLAVAMPGPNRILCLVEEDNAVAGWELPAARKLFAHPGPALGKFTQTQGVFSAAYSADGKLVAYGGSDTLLSVRNADDGKELYRFDGHKGPVGFVGFSSDRRSLITCSWYGQLFLLEPTSGNIKLAMGGNGLGFGDLSPDGKVLATGGANGPQRVLHWDAATGKEMLTVGHQGPITSIAYSPDGKWIASASLMRGDSVARLWVAATGQQVRALHGNHQQITSIAFAPDGKTLATAGGLSYATVRLWDPATGTVRRDFDATVSAKWITSFFPDGKRLVIADHNANGLGACDVKIHDVDSGKTVVRIARPKDSAPCVALSPDGLTLALACADELKMFDAKTGSERRWIAKLPKARRPNHLAFAPDGRILAVTRYGQPVILYEMASQRELAQLPPSVSVAFSPGSRFVAHSGWNDGIRIHDLATGQDCLTLHGHPGAPEGYAASLAFAPDGRRLVSGGRDATAVIWDVSDLDALTPLRSDREVNAAALTDWWSDLIDLDPKKAHRAMWNFAAAGAAAVPFLKARLKAEITLDAAQFARIIDSLGDPAFAVRTRAAKELEALGETAEEPLRQALANKPPLETSRRIELLLAKLASHAAATEQLRTTRALGALERMAQGAAHALLQALAQGPPAARLTREAKLALARKTNGTQPISK